MRPSWPSFLLTLSCASFASADILITSPTAGDSIQAPLDIQIRWRESGGVRLADLSRFQIDLLVGGLTDETSMTLSNITGRTGDHKAGSRQATLHIDPTRGPPGENSYYLRMKSERTDGGHALITYSPRFSLLNMTGQWSLPADDEPRLEIRQAAGAAAAANPAAAAAANPAAAAPAAAAPAAAAPAAAAPAAAAPAAGAAPAAAAAGADTAAAAGGEYTVPYQLQTAGAVKYAPMQQQPGKSITAGNLSPLFPSSGFNVAVTALAPPTWQTTHTAPGPQRTYQINQANAADAPANDGSNNAGGTNNDMAKYLRRWAD